jgi:tight adherence protein B
MGAARARNRRMRMIARGVDENKIAEALLRNQTTSGSKARGPVDRLRRGLARANLPFGPGAVLAFSVALAGGILFAALHWTPAPTAICLALGLGLAVPYAIIDRMAETRQKKLSEQLPDALDMMARGLRIGHPLNVTLRRVARDMPDPIGTEFGLLEDRIRHGEDLTTAFKEFADRVDSEDVHYLSVCVGIQHGTGGNLARVLSVLSRVIRDRLNMRKKIRAISSEGRLSGVILTVMPFLIFGTIYSSTPSFFVDVQDHPIFMPVAALVLILIALQAVILHRLTNFDF